MKPGIIKVLASAFAFLFVFTAFNPWGLAQDPDTLYYSCSNQVYKALERQKLAAFTRDTGIQVSVSALSSSSAVFQLLCGRTELASTTSHLYARHIECGLQQIPVCKDPLAVITRKGCGVDSLTEKQVQGIFSGIITNWSEVGGKDLQIIVIVPGEETAASRNFRKKIMAGREIKYHIITWASTMAVIAVNYFPCGAVSFIGQGAASAEPEIRSVKIEGKLPGDPDYPYYQVVYYVIKGSRAGGAVGEFIDYTFSEKGRKLIKESGMIPRPQMREE